MSRKHKDKGRLPPFVPLLISTIESPAWRAMSHGAKVLYVALRRRVSNGRNRAYVSYRHAESELRSSQRKIGEWFRELEHYGFIVLAVPSSLGVEGKGKSPHWRLTELGVTGRASSEGSFEPPTRDFLKWDGNPFKKQKPASYGGYTPLPTSEAVVLPAGDTTKSQSASYGVGIERLASASHGVGITSLTTMGGSEEVSSRPPNESENSFAPMIRELCRSKIGVEPLSAGSGPSPQSSLTSRAT